MSFKDETNGFSYQSYETYVMVSEATWDDREACEMDALTGILEAQNQAWKLYKLISNCNASEEVRIKMFEAWFDMNNYLWVVRDRLSDVLNQK